MKCKLFFYFFFIIIISSFVSSLNFSVSPKSLNFSGNKNKLICQNVSVEISDNSSIIIYTKWINGDKTKNIADYNITNSEANIEFNYSKVSSNKYEICLKSKYIDNKNGMVFFRVRDKPLGIVIPTTFHVVQNENPLSILKSKQYDKVDKKLILLIPILILIIEILILIKKKI